MKDAGAASTVSKDSKLSTKSRLFSTQLSRQKWKDQMAHKEGKRIAAAQDFLRGQAVAEDVLVEDFDGECRGESPPNHKRQAVYRSQQRARDSDQ
jgi:hypothetical protein